MTLTTLTHPPEWQLITKPYQKYAQCISLTRQHMHAQSLAQPNRGDYDHILSGIYMLMSLYFGYFSKNWQHIGLHESIRKKETLFRRIMFLDRPVKEKNTEGLF